MEPSGGPIEGSNSMGKRIWKRYDPTRLALAAPRSRGDRKGRWGLATAPAERRYDRTQIPINKVLSMSAYLVKT